MTNHAHACAHAGFIVCKLKKISNTKKADVSGDDDENPNADDDTADAAAGNADDSD